MRLTLRSLSVASLLVLGLLNACGGKQLGEPDGGIITEPDGAVCVDINLATYDTSCNSDSDCSLIVGGQICSRSCLCPGAPVSASEVSRYQSAISVLPPAVQTCDCALLGVPRCVNKTCTICGPGSTDPSCNPDGGSGGADGGGGSDGTAGSDGSSGAEGGAGCVNIDLSTYDQSCNVASDCVVIVTGEVCSGSCACGGSPVNKSGEARWKAATAGIKFDACPCASEQVVCSGGMCAFCTDPKGCTDGG